MADENSTRRADADDYVTRAGLGAGEQVFGHYRLETLAGRGGMGVVAFAITGSARPGEATRFWAARHY
jgi:hypothetical protein